MDVRDNSLPDDPEELKRLLLEQQLQFAQQQRNAQKTIDEQQKLIDRHTKTHQSTLTTTETLREKVTRQRTRIEILEEQLKLLRLHQFGKRSEKLFNPDQWQLFNEPEIIADEPGSDHGDASEEDETISVPGHTRKKRQSRAIPPELERVDVVHDLEEDEKQCVGCGNALQRIGEDVTEQLCVIPQQHFALRHRRQKYACSCKGCIRTAHLPAQPIPGSQASPRLLSDVMIRKYLDGLPLYRQERIAKRDGLDLPRDKLARWVIAGSEVLVPLLKCLEDAFFSHDIAWSDDTGIRVLKEDGRMASSQSALWIRRGGPPDKPVVLVDYEISKSGETAYRLLSEFKGYLVSDGADNFKLSVRRNELTSVLCNDHARRRFRKALSVVTKTDAKTRARGSVAKTALDWYGKLYRIERESKHLSPEDRLVVRQSQAMPLWSEFLEWATRVHTAGVAHGRTQEALSYLLKHQAGLQQYCTDGRLPMSNILAEHVAKTIAIARKNFLFSDTPSGATASARVFSLIETARANGHNPHHYLSVLLTELPTARTLEEVEQLLPWNLSTADVSARYGRYPIP